MTSRVHRSRMAIVIALLLTTAAAAGAQDRFAGAVAGTVFAPTVTGNTPRGTYLMGASAGVVFGGDQSDVVSRELRLLYGWRGRSTPQFGQHRLDYLEAGLATRLNGPWRMGPIRPFGTFGVSIARALQCREGGGTENFPHSGPTGGVPCRPLQRPNHVDAAAMLGGGIRVGLGGGSRILAIEARHSRSFLPYNGNGFRMLDAVTQVSFAVYRAR